MLNLFTVVCRFLTRNCKHFRWSVQIITFTSKIIYINTHPGKMFSLINIWLYFVDIWERRSCVNIYNVITWGGVHTTQTHHQYYAITFVLDSGGEQPDQWSYSSWMWMIKVKMNDCQDLMADDDELQLRVPPVLDHDICGGRRPSRMGRIEIRRYKQKFFTVYDGSGKCWGKAFIFCCCSGFF